jgi:hypothetical protein
MFGHFQLIPVNSLQVKCALLPQVPCMHRRTAAHVDTASPPALRYVRTETGKSKGSATSELRRHRGCQKVETASVAAVAGRRAGVKPQTYTVTITSYDDAVK